MNLIAAILFILNLLTANVHVITSVPDAVIITYTAPRCPNPWDEPCYIYIHTDTGLVEPGP